MKTKQLTTLKHFWHNTDTLCCKFKIGEIIKKYYNFGNKLCVKVESYASITQLVTGKKSLTVTVISLHCNHNFTQTLPNS